MSLGCAVVEDVQLLSTTLGADVVETVLNCYR